MEGAPAPARCNSIPPRDEQPHASRPLAARGFRFSRRHGPLGSRRSTAALFCRHGGAARVTPTFNTFLAPFLFTSQMARCREKGARPEAQSSPIFSEQISRIFRSRPRQKGGVGNLFSPAALAAANNPRRTARCCRPQDKSSDHTTLVFPL